MRLASLLTLGFITLANGQGITSTHTVQSNVPTGTPIPGDYTGAYRPQIHYSPPSGFMNDPNGMFRDAQGVYHLYYQYNPNDTVAGNQHWGHATSKDLYHWTNQAIAIYPENEGEGIFSGSCVIDVNNTSGFFPNQTNGVVAFYTLNTEEEETQDLAYSTDGGYTFTKYSENPILSINSTQFRDPKVMYYAPTSTWVMVVAYAQDFVIGFYTSRNLKDWSHASNFSHWGLLGLQYECPNLIPIPMLKNSTVTNPLDSSNFDTSSEMYILAISINPGAPLGGSIAQYFPGNFNGTHFTPVDNAARIADFGKDNYAGQWFYGIPETSPQVSIAWASNWQYSQVVPTGPLEGFRSVMSLPRYNVLANTTRQPYNLISLPYEISTIQTTSQPLATLSKGNSSLLYDYSATVPSGAVRLCMNITNIPLTDATGTANFTFLSSVTGETVRGGFYLGGDTPFFINRGNVRGFDNPFFTNSFSTNNLIDPDTRDFRLEVIIDRAIIEVFIGNGFRSATNTFFAEGVMDTLIVATKELSEGVEVQAEVFGLESTWAAEESPNGNGTVRGNVTRMGEGQRVRRDVFGHLELDG